MNGSPIDFNRIYTAANYYGIIMIFITLFEIFITNNQISNTDTISKMAKLSQYFIAVQAALDSFLSIFHFIIGLQSSQVAQTFLIVALLKFILFTFFELRYMLLIWKSHNPADISVEDFRTEATKFYIEFYIFLCCGIFLYQYFIVSLLYFIILYSGWIFQIYHTAYYNYRRKTMKDVYLYGITFTRLFIPLYLFLSPGYIRKVVFSNEYYIIPSILLLLWVIFQIVVIRFQEKISPRFFIPKSLLPPIYDYHRDIPDV